MHFDMDRVRRVYTYLIILLLIILAILSYNYQGLVNDNRALKLKISKQAETLISPAIEPVKHSQAEPIIRKNDTDNECPIKVTEKSEITLPETPKEESTASEEILPFEEQVIDYEWAIERETVVSDLFQTHELLDRLILDNVECRATSCKVTMLEGAKGSSHQVTLATMALKDIGLVIKSYKFSLEATDNKVIFYFSTVE